MTTTATISQNTQVSFQSEKQTKLAAKKESLLSWLNGMFTATWAGGMASRTKTGQKVIEAVKNTKAIKKTAEVLKNVKKAKTIATWLSRIIKGGAIAVGAAAAPVTGGASLAVGAAVGLAAGFALDLVAGEAIDAGITMANGGKVLDSSKGDWIKLGDWMGQGMHKLMA